METARIAFAPKLFLFSVPSESIINLSLAIKSLTSFPIKIVSISFSTESIALSTPFPEYLVRSPSLFSFASY